MTVKYHDTPNAQCHDEETMWADLVHLSLDPADLEVEELEARLSLVATSPPTGSGSGGMCGTCTTPG